MESFRFKQFNVQHQKSSMKIGTDGVLLGAWAHVSDAKMALDIGTGTGVIALMMAQRNSDLIIDAVEIDAASSEEALENVKSSDWSNRIYIHNTSVQEFAKEPDNRNKYDLIVSNPPFYTGGTLSENMSRNEVRHTKKLSHNELLMAVKKMLKSEGLFEMVLPYLEGLRFIELAEDYGLFLVQKTEVRPTKESEIKRLLLSFSPHSKKLIEDSLIIQHEERNNWTEEYWELVGDFYLDRS